LQKDTKNMAAAAGSAGRRSARLRRPRDVEAEAEAVLEAAAREEERLAKRARVRRGRREEAVVAPPGGGTLNADSSAAAGSSSSSESRERAPAAATAVAAAAIAAPAAAAAAAAAAESVFQARLAAQARLGRRRAGMSQATRERLARALSQRLFLISQAQTSDVERSYSVLGSTGNVYRVTIGSRNSCTCPDASRGNLCKHVLFVLVRVLKIPADNPLSHQRIFSEDERRDIFLLAPPPPAQVLAEQRVRQELAKLEGRPDDAAAAVAAAAPAAPEAKRVEQRPTAGLECPVCYEDFGDESTVFCQFSCGQSVHAECFKRWSATLVSKREFSIPPFAFICFAMRRGSCDAHTRSAGESVTCPYCRSDWEGPKVVAAAAAAAAAPRSVGGSVFRGYVNLGAFSSEHAGVSADAVYTDRRLYKNSWRRRRDYDDDYRPGEDEDEEEEGEEDDRDD
jgi:hypothetical protein